MAATSQKPTRGLQKASRGICDGDRATQPRRDPERGDPPFHHPPQSAHSQPPPAQRQGLPPPVSGVHTRDLSGYLTEVGLRACAQLALRPLRAGRVCSHCAHMCTCVCTHAHSHACTGHRREPRRMGCPCGHFQYSEGMRFATGRGPWGSAWTRRIVYHGTEGRNLPEQTQ